MPPTGFLPDMAANHDIFQNRFIAEQADILKGPGNAVFAYQVWWSVRYVLTFKHNSPFGGRVKSCNHIETGGFTGPVGTDQSDNAASRDGRVEVLDRREPLEAHGQILVSRTYSELMIACSKRPINHGH